MCFVFHFSIPLAWWPFANVIINFAKHYTKLFTSKCFCGFPHFGYFSISWDFVMKSFIKRSDDSSRFYRRLLCLKIGPKRSHFLSGHLCPLHFNFHTNINSPFLSGFFFSTTVTPSKQRLLSMLCAVSYVWAGHTLFGTAVYAESQLCVYLESMRSWAETRLRNEDGTASTSSCWGCSNSEQSP